MDRDAAAYCLIKNDELLCYLGNGGVLLFFFSSVLLGFDVLVQT